MASVFQRTGSVQHARIQIVRVLAALAMTIVFLFPASTVSADWSLPVRLSDEPALDAKIAAVGSNVHAVYYSLAAPAGIYYKRSTDGGKTWSAAVMVSDTGAQPHASIVVLGDTVHLLWATVMNIYYRRSTDGGLTWSASFALGTETGSAFGNIAASGNNVYAAIYNSASEENVRRSTDGGVTWGPAFQLSAPGEVGEIPEISASGNYVHVVWMDTAPSIRYARSVDGGQTWGAATGVPMSGVAMGFPAVAAEGGTAHVVAMRVVPPGTDVAYLRSADGGLTWSPDVSLGNDAIPFVTRPHISSFGGGLAVAWEGNMVDGSNVAMYLARSYDSGRNWAAAQVVLPSVRFLGQSPELAASGTNIYIAFPDIRPGDAGPTHYFMKYSAASVVNINSPQGVVRMSASDGTFGSATSVVGSCAPAGYTFPYGMFAFNLTNLAPGETVTVTITFPNPIPANAKYFKCQDSGAVDCSPFMTIVDQNTIRLRLTDGGNGDSDHSANGTIVDPGGPGFPLNLNPASHGASMPAPAQSPVALPNVSVKSASLSANKVAPGTPVTVTAQVANNGAVNGTGRITVYVNGAEESVQGVTVNSGSTMPVTFTVSRSQPGVYAVYAGGVQAGSFTVDEFADPNTVLYISMGLLGLALVVGAVYFTRRRRQGN